jgi:hypothetical protein
MRKKLLLIAVFMGLVLSLGVGSVSAASPNARARERSRIRWGESCECGLCVTEGGGVFDPLCDPPGPGGFVGGRPGVFNSGWCLGWVNLAGMPNPDPFF